MRLCVEHESQFNSNYRPPNGFHYNSRDDREYVCMYEYATTFGKDLIQKAMVSIQI